MDPSLPPPSNFEVPHNRPAGNMMPLNPSAQETGPALPEVAHNTANYMPPMQPNPDPTQAVGPAPQAAPPPLPGATQGQAIHPAAPATADDLDLIEKEWVNKAKAIVAETKHDPYNQNKEMNKFKADYMKKRYNKDIKIEA